MVWTKIHKQKVHIFHVDDRASDSVRTTRATVNILNIEEWPTGDKTKNFY